MTVLEYLTTHPDTPHPDIYICFTPDEEVGKGSDHIDLDVFAPDFCYTIDGSHRGEFSIGNFNADKIRVIFHGHSVHPGHAKGKLINAIKIAQTFLDQLPQEHSPETTEALQ